jgi:hypothetical protein
MKRIKDGLNDALLLANNAVNALKANVMHDKFKIYFSSDGKPDEIRDLFQRIYGKSKDNLYLYTDKIIFTKTDVAKLCSDKWTVAYNTNSQSGDRTNYQSRIILCDSAWKRLNLRHDTDACAKLSDKVKEKNMESFARVILHEMM